MAPAGTSRSARWQRFPCFLACQRGSRLGAANRQSSELGGWKKYFPVYRDPTLREDRMGGRKTRHRVLVSGEDGKTGWLNDHAFITPGPGLPFAIATRVMWRDVSGTLVIGNTKRCGRRVSDGATVRGLRHFCQGHIHEALN